MNTENFANGKIAEKIVRDLFVEAGFKVINYGYEYTVPELADRNNLIKGPSANFIRHQPDFIVVNDKNEAFFVEVKFRKQGKIKKEHMFNYPSAYVVFLTQDFILAQSLKNIYREGDNFNLLNRITPFSKIPNSLIYKYVRIVRRKLGKETLTGQMVEKLAEKLVKKKFWNEITKPEIEGGNITKDGWERLNSPPKLIFRKDKQKRAKRINKKTIQLKGDHYCYRIKFGIDDNARVFRKKRGKK